MEEINYGWWRAWSRFWALFMFFGSFMAFPFVCFSFFCFAQSSSQKENHKSDGNVFIHF